MTLCPATRARQREQRGPSDAVAAAPVRAGVARYLLQRLVRDVPVAVVLPDGTRVGAQGPVPVMEILEQRFFDRIGRDHKIGVGEGFMAGEWRPGPGTDLADLLTPFAERLTDIVPPGLRRFRRVVEQRHPREEDNDRRGSRSNISRHYDLSNEVFAAFLDETMTYSSALFDEPTRASGFAGLATAQRRKVGAILDLAHVAEGTRVLEIGSGWGQLAIQAAERGASIESITLSVEQLDLARRRVEDAGLTDRVELRLQDYRDVAGTYDAVVSVEMIEAVGERHLGDYFAAVSRALRPGGRFGLQSIVMPHARMLESRRAYSWVHKYIFPGGFIPSLTLIEQHASRVGLQLEGGRAMGQDYARTLRLWREKFVQSTDRVRSAGFDETFERVFQYYLAYSEAGFRSGHLDVWQLGMVKNP